MIHELPFATLLRGFVRSDSEHLTTADGGASMRKRSRAPTTRESFRASIRQMLDHGYFILSGWCSPAAGCDPNRTMLAAMIGRLSKKLRPNRKFGVRLIGRHHYYFDSCLAN